MHEPSGDLRRVVEALHEQWPDRVSDEEITADLHVMRGLQVALRKGKWQVIWRFATATGSSGSGLG